MSKPKRSILITGCTRGLGRALTDELIPLGHTVIGCGRNEAHIAELKEQYSAPHRFDALDVIDAKTVEQWAQSVFRSHGAPDLLINNAALINHNAPLWKVPTEEFNRVIDVNIKGVASVIRAFVPTMIERGSGMIINISSGLGKSTIPNVAPYCATKFAVEGLTSALAQEFVQETKDLAAIALSPGVIDTDMARLWSAEAAATQIKPPTWAKLAVPYILGLSVADNGKSLSVPGAG